jgi:hypothetical protein
MLGLVMEKPNIQNLKDKRESLFRKLQLEVIDGNDGEKTKTSKRRSIMYLKKEFGEEGDLLGNKIEDCGKGNYCSSLYCNECGERISNYFYSRWIREFEKGNKIWSITILDGLCRLDENSIKDWIKNFRRKMELVRKNDKTFYIDGWIELELVDKNVFSSFRYGDDSERRKVEYVMNSIKEFEKENNKERYYIIPHFHGMIREGNLDKSGLSKLLKKYFKDRWSVEIRKFGRGVVGKKGYQRIDVGINTWAKYIIKLGRFRKQLYTNKLTFDGSMKMYDDELFKSYRLSYVVIANMMLIHQRIKGITNKGLIVRVGK